jgi:hypothetical protein
MMQPHDSGDSYWLEHSQSDHHDKAQEYEQTFHADMLLEV